MGHDWIGWSPAIVGQIGACVSGFRGLRVDLYQRRVRKEHVNPKDHFADVNGVRLTRREQQIVAELSDGRTNREIAETFGVSANTIKAQLTTLYRKVGVRGRLELVIRALGGAPE
jgi:DNA-binding CsgD family transcriptional regulator